MKLQLDFMVDPEYLSSHCEVEDAVRIVFSDPEAVFITGILGESGRRMVLAGFPFIFKRTLAEKFIRLGIATLAKREAPAEGEV